MSKVLSVRLNKEDERRLKALAQHLDVGPSVLARILLHTSLANLQGLKAAAKAGRFPLSLLSDLLAPAAQAKGLTEEDLKRSVKAARRKLWKERYAEP